jgi:hypothetical protein
MTGSSATDPRRDAPDVRHDFASGLWNLIRAGGLYSPALVYSNAEGGPDGHTPLSPVGRLS